MFAEVDGREFKAALSRVVIGTKPVLSLRLCDKFLYIQSRKAVVADTVVPVIRSDVTIPYDISITYNKAVSLLNDSEAVQLIVDAHILTIRQNSFTCIAEEVPEDRVDVSLGQNSQRVKMSVTELMQMYSASKALSRAMKELGASTGSFQFKDGYGYLVLGDIAVRRKVTIPNCSITGSTISELMSFVERSSIIESVIDNDAKFIRLVQANAVALTIPYRSADERTIEVFNKILENAKFELDMSFTKVTSIYKEFLSAFTKIPVDVMFTEDQLVLYVEDGKVHCTIGASSHAGISIRITMGQLYAIISLFGTSPRVSVMRNTNCMILRDQFTTLIVSGLVLS